MSIRTWCATLMLMLCLVLAGCTPTAETQMDEQRNPHYLAGKEKLGALDYKGAIESFERAVEDNPRSALAHFELGVLFEQREADYAAALYHYNKALKLRPTGYPAENIRQRIPACKQELVKADSLAIINPTALRETENLRAENAALRNQIELLRAQLAARPVSVAAQGGSPTTRDSSGTVPPANDASASGRSETPRGSVTTPSSSTTQPRTGNSTSPTASRSGRTHTVQSGDTLMSIARRYGVKVTALQSANPGLDPKRMRVGQTLSVPAP